MIVYQKSEEVKNPYFQLAQLPTLQHSAQYEDANIKRAGVFNPKLMSAVMRSSIRSLALAQNEEHLIFSSDNNQIIKTLISIDKRCEEASYEFLVYPFHSSSINGMDICLRKQLVVTCGHDNTIRVWNYHTKSLEICEVYLDEPLSIAFHPSGLHIVCGFHDKIRLMNVFSRNLKTYLEIPIKGVREIKFSNGGHLFAIADNFNIKVFRFYTATCPEKYIFKEHLGRVKSVAWLDDDSGFVSAGQDGLCISWRLNPDNLEIINAERKSEDIIVTKSSVLYKVEARMSKFSDVAVKTESKNIFYTVSEDRHLKEIESGKEKIRFEVGVNYSQLVSMYGSKTFIASISETERPGSIQFLRNPWEKLCEIQAHSLGIEKIRLSYDNQTLLSIGKDGVLCVFDVKDKEPKIRKDGKEIPTIIPGDDILIQKSERDRFKDDISQLRKEINIKRATYEDKIKAQLYRAE